MVLLFPRLEMGIKIALSNRELINWLPQYKNTLMFKVMLPFKHHRVHLIDYLLIWSRANVIPNGIAFNDCLWRRILLVKFHLGSS
ncbi:hypothetical protein NC651_019190 [Populus alba x Populus x berolinensis]|nr:hypothetical protein NC651_019190 [Populus alba x Populus x berolinensis]